MKNLNLFPKTSLQTRLTKYSLLIISFNNISEVVGQIVYTDIEPDFNGSLNSYYFFDIDNNGTIDFNIVNNASIYYTSYYPDPIIISNRLLLYRITNSILGSLGDSGLAYPLALDEGDYISSGRDEWTTSSVQVMQYSSTCAFGNWCNVSDKYLGLRFNINGNNHYGWARLDIGNTPDSFIIKDYAYNTSPSEPISAGQTTLGITENEILNVRIIVKNRIIELHNTKKFSDYRIYNISGKKVIENQVMQESDVTYIKGNLLSKGIYIIELLNKGTKSYFRKKVVLN